MLRQRPFRCLTQPVTTPESKFTQMPCLESLSLKKDRRSLKAVLLRKKYRIERRRCQGAPVSGLCNNNHITVWPLHTHEKCPGTSNMSACRRLFTFLPRQEQVVLLEFGDLHSRTVVSASISWKTSSSGFAGCGVWRQGRTCLIPANFLESRMGITQRVVRRICN